MISIMIKSAIVLAVAACIATALRRKSAAMRHVVWTAGLVGALVVPLCTVALPSWQNGIAGRIIGRVEPFFQATANRYWPLWRIAIGIWIGGAIVGMLLMLFGALRLAWVAVRSEPVTDPRWLNMAEQVRRSLGFRRPVRLLQNQTSRFLGTWGILSPRVLLPFNADRWSDERAWMVLGHELSHIKRHDWVVQVFAEAARAIYWFNPVFWLAYSRLRRESEQACDDAVIRMGAGGTQYAEELLELARTLRKENSMRSPILAMAQPSHLEQRLVALLDPALNRLAATPWSVVVVAVVAIGLTLPLAAVRAPEAEKVVLLAPPLPRAVSNPVAPETQVSTPVRVEPQRLAASPVSHELPKAEMPAFLAPIVEQVETPLPTLMTANLALSPIVPPRVAAPPPIECKVTPSVQETKMKETKSALGAGPWHINDDRTIWAWDQPYIAGAAVNTMWMKPANAELVITGRRLDGDSEPLKIQPAKDSTAGYIAASLIFPKEGCWEVTATAGSSKLTFITRVEPQ